MQKDKLPKSNVAPLAGLVLAGGKSTRMGHDKGLIEWHGKPQRYFLADLLNHYCERVFISCRSEQVDDIVAVGYNALPDNAIAKAQYGAILTALKAQPNNAWLVVACDLPLLNSDALKYLINERDPSKLATVYSSPNSGLPEPLAAIWEPRAEEMLLREFAAGIDCPRKALIRNEGDVKLVDPPTPGVIMNVNTPETAQVARELIAQYVG